MGFKTFMTWGFLPFHFFPLQSPWGHKAHRCELPKRLQQSTEPYYTTIVKQVLLYTIYGSESLKTTKKFIITLHKKPQTEYPPTCLRIYRERSVLRWPSDKKQRRLYFLLGSSANSHKPPFYLALLWHFHRDTILCGSRSDLRWSSPPAWGGCDTPAVSHSRLSLHYFQHFLLVKNPH